jgi:hypothetical protein
LRSSTSDKCTRRAWSPTDFARQRPRCQTTPDLRRSAPSTPREKQTTRSLGTSPKRQPRPDHASVGDGA